MPPSTPHFHLLDDRKGEQGRDGSVDCVAAGSEHFRRAAETSSHWPSPCRATSRRLFLTSEGGAGMRAPVSMAANAICRSVKEVD